MKYVSYTVYLVHENSSKKSGRNLEEKNVGTKGRSPEQDLTSTEDLTIGLSEGR